MCRRRELKAAQEGTDPSHRLIRVRSSRASRLKSPTCHTYRLRFGILDQSRTLMLHQYTRVVTASCFPTTDATDHSHSYRRLTSSPKDTHTTQTLCSCLRLQKTITYFGLRKKEKSRRDRILSGSFPQESRRLAQYCSHALRVAVGTCFQTQIDRPCEPKNPGCHNSDPSRHWTKMAKTRLRNIQPNTFPRDFRHS